jgi:hypothetical protein
LNNKHKEKEFDKFYLCGPEEMITTVSNTLKEHNIPEKAIKFVEELSNVFRYSLTNSDEILVTLSEELTLLNSYFELQLIRHQGLIKLESSVDVSKLDYLIPPLTLEILIENALKHTVFDSINTSIFTKNSIVDLDLRTSGISKGKKSFFNLEINLYTLSEMDFKSIEIKDSVKTIVKSIYKNNVIQNKYFEFSNSKKEDPQ